jgi:hypothetical protein
MVFDYSGRYKSNIRTGRKIITTCGCDRPSRYGSILIKEQEDEEMGTVTAVLLNTSCAQSDRQHSYVSLDQSKFKVVGRVWAVLGCFGSLWLSNK